MTANERNLDTLIERAQKSIERLETIKKGDAALPMKHRMAKHARNNGGSLFNILMAGAALAVAAGRLNQKYEHEAQRQVWEESMKALEEENERLRQQLVGAPGGMQQNSKQQRSTQQRSTQQSSTQQGSWFGSWFGKGSSGENDGGTAGGTAAAQAGGQPKRTMI